MSIMDMVAELLSDTSEIRPNSPSIRPAKKPVNKGFSPNSPHSPPGRGKTEKKAQGYGCAGCGNRIYEMVQEWEISELPVSSPWKHEHTPVIHWQCESCKTIYEIIGGSKGPQPLN
jgi:hypothetical protein